MLKSALNGTDIGDLNHSKDFPPKFRPFVAKEVSKNLTTFFTTRQVQTGFKPPVNVQADKGTNCRRTRQFTSVITIIPNSPSLLTHVYLGQPVVKEHNGKGVAKSIADQVQLWNIDSGQIEGGSFDGQYFHLSVPEHLKDILGLPDHFKCIWDPLHKGGLVDTHIRKGENFVWLLNVQAAVSGYL